MAVKAFIGTTAEFIKGTICMFASIWTSPFGFCLIALLGILLGLLTYENIRISKEVAEFLGYIIMLIIWLITLKPVKRFLKRDELTKKEGD